MMMGMAPGWDNHPGAARTRDSATPGLRGPRERVHPERSAHGGRVDVEPALSTGFFFMR
ncbi:hypothetical protein D187_002981 [Cystobacter fuscus DSM 2262]|uniref:Uncharacterized protein n=1 Tax=Cystobacter fuscus (strain ATCC 25194 / DSM 2262 / NBRC 100088 / M29) TaxID=1242864 RepID=S9P8M5_CYSF2|nr:hypothetical protein D187_002981 [Cystobacter fuscus DSM 2262]